MKKLLLFLSLAIAGCSKNHEIKGNWYTFSRDELNVNESNKNLNEVYYEEIFVSEKNIFTYSNISGLSPAYTYKYKNDSIFIGIGMGSELLDFRGIVHFLDENTYTLTNEFQKIDTFQRIINDRITLDKYLIIKDNTFDFKSDTIYTQEFINRNQNVLGN